MFVVLAALASISGCLMAWQWIASVRFPLNRRQPVPPALPSVTVLKPVRGADPGTAEALESWLKQKYPGPIEILFGIDAPEDPAAEIIRDLLNQHAGAHARLVLCPQCCGANRKVSTLIQMERVATGSLVLISDADVEAPPDLVAQMALPFSDPGVGLVHCLYRLAESPTVATRWETFTANADFWSQVLQDRTLEPLRYALGAAMSLRRPDLHALGGFQAVADFLADDHRLGRLVVALGKRTELCPVVVDCRVAPAGWRRVWAHQLRWAITIRVSQPVAYFLSILANGTAWPLLWLIVAPSNLSLLLGPALLVLRIVQGLALEARFTQRAFDWRYAWIVPLKDTLQVCLWLAAHVWSRITWRGRRFRVRRDGRLVPQPSP